MKLKQETKRNPLFLIVFGLSVYFIFLNFDVVLNIIKRIISIMSPFIMGFGITYLSYAPMMFIEDKILGKLALYENMTLKNRRKISYFLTLILFFLILFVLIFALVPELISTVEDIVDKMPQYSDNLNKLLISKIFEQFELIQNIDVNQLQTKAIDYIENSWRDLAGSTFTIMSSFSAVFSLSL